MASNLEKKIKEIEDTKLKPGELFMYGHCGNGAQDGELEISAGLCCEEADLESIERTLQYIAMQTAKQLYDCNPEITKAEITEILFTDLFGTLNLFLADIDRDKDEDEIRAEAADLLTDCFEDFDFYDDYE